MAVAGDAVADLQDFPSAAAVVLGLDDGIGEVYLA